MANPSILTLALDDNAQNYFNKLRKKHFPPERNFLDAHLTLFHQLPTDDPKLINDLHDVTREQQTFIMEVTSPVSIGNGVAFKIESGTLSLLHKNLQKQWAEWLIPQDKQTLWPHVTIQNKTSAAVARLLIGELNIDFVPFQITAMGLSLWEYLGGPWRFIATYPFNGDQK